MPGVAMEAPAQRYQGVQKESAGYKLLASMGWKEGEGLGASKQGIKEHIRVKKKFENWGVGAVSAAAAAPGLAALWRAGGSHQRVTRTWFQTLTRSPPPSQVEADRARDWSGGMLEFHRVLSTLSEVTSQHANKRTDGSSSEDSDASDGEGAAARRKAGKGAKRKKGADGGEPAGNAKRASKGKGAADADADAAAAAKAAKAAKKKAKRAKKGGKAAAAPPAEPSSSSDGGAAAAPPPAQRARKAATHLGRFKKRENAKSVRNYSTTDLAAILGGDPFAEMAAALGEVRSEAAAGGASSSGSDGEGGGGAAAARPPAPAPRSLQQQAERRAAEAAAEAARRAEEDAAGLWWSGYFTRSGRMGALKRAPVDKAPRGFSEQDQTDLYTRAHDKATKGRVGLGRAGATKKVGGANWEGKRTKISLGSDSEEEEEEEEEEEGEGEGEEAAGIVIVMPASHRQSEEQAADGGAAADDAVLSGVKWKRAVAAALAGSCKSGLKLGRLARGVLKREGLDRRHLAAVEVRVAACVRGSSKFALAEGVVQLAG
jgi:Pin2-interacting protein X1